MLRRGAARRMMLLRYWKKVVRILPFANGDPLFLEAAKSVRSMQCSNWVQPRTILNILGYQRIMLASHSPITRSLMSRSAYEGVQKKP